MVFIAGLLATAVLSWVSFVVSSRNEVRLLDLQTKEAGTVLQVILPTIETPLASAVEIAATNGGDAASFRTYISAYIGARGPFVAAALWKTGEQKPIATVGDALRLDSVPERAGPFLATTTPGLRVIGLLDSAPERLGYAYASASESPSYVVYAESALPAERRVVVEPDSPFSDLRFALYLGDSADPTALLETNADHLPIEGRSATVVVPFGSSSLSLVASASRQLGGFLSAWLWLLVAVFGAMVAVLAALAVARLARRQQAAEVLTADVQRLLGEQRTIAETLQHAMLPQAMPEIDGIEIATRYIPGANGVEIGGDWYDVIPLDEHRFFFVVGDVSGRGVGAGTVMASLRFSIRAFVSEGHTPEQVLARLSTLLNVGRDEHFATALCGIADIDRHEVTLANAGHLPPLIVSEDHSEYVTTCVGPPIGVGTAATYGPATVIMPARSILLAFTDGLVERRGERLDQGLGRLLDWTSGKPRSLEDLLGEIVADLADDGHDDTAILGVRWRQ